MNVYSVFRMVAGKPQFVDVWGNVGHAKAAATYRMSRVDAKASEWVEMPNGWRRGDWRVVTSHVFLPQE